MQKRVFLKHGSRYDAHFKLNANRGRVHSFQLYEKGCEEGGVSYPEFQILQLRRYLRYICNFLMVWGTFHLPLINQYKTQTSCSSKKRGKYLQNISLREMASILFRLFCLVEWAQLSFVRIKTNLQRKKRIKN